MKEVNKLLFFAYMLIAFTPILGSMYLSAFIALLWVATAILTNTAYWRKVKIDWISVIFLWLFYEIFLKIVGYSMASWGNYGVHILYFFPVIVFSYYKKVLTQKEMRNMAYLGGIILFANMLYNIYLLYKMPNANLELNFSDKYSGINLGNTDFTLYIMAFLLIVFIKLMRGQKKSLIILIPGIIYLAMSSKTTALLVCLVVIVMMLVDKLTETLGRRYKIIIMIFSVAIFFILYRYGLQFLIKVINNDYITNRIIALLEGDLSSSYLSRWSLAEISLKSFLSNPVLGVGYVKVSGSFASSGIGHHSEVIDHMGRYGMIGIVFFVIIYSGYWKSVKSLTDNAELKRMAGIYCLGILLYSVLNNSCFLAMGIILFWLFPTFIYLENKTQ